MQFLSDVYLRCPDCNGKRYRDEVLEIKREGANKRRASIADVLDMTVTEALAFFADRAEVAHAARAARGCGPRVREARSARADAFRRRSAAAEARGPSRRGRRALPRAPRITASCSCSTSRPPACTSRTWRSCCARSASCWRPATRCSSSSTTSISFARRTGSSTSGPKAATAAARSSASGTPAEVRANRALVHGQGARRVRAGAARAMRRSPSRSARAHALDRRRAARRVTRARTGAARNSVVIHNAREHNLKNIDVRDSARLLHGDHGRVGLGQVHARLRHSVQRRPAPLSGIAQRLRAPVRAAGGAAGRGCDLRHSADRGHRAAHEPRRPQEHGRDAHGDLSLPAPALREARHAALPGLRRAHRAAERGIHRRAPAEGLSRQAHLAARAARRRAQGLLHGPREVGREEGLQDAARRRREHLRRSSGRACRASRSTPSSCRWRRSTSTRRPTRRCTRRSRARSTSARASCTCSGPKSRRRSTVFSTKRACPSCGRSFAELDPRLFSFNSKHGWCESCFGTGVEMTGFDEEQSGEEIWWNDWYEHEPTACAACEGQRLNPVALNVRFRDRSIASLTSEPIEESAEFFSKLKLNPREQEIARDLLAEIRARLQFPRARGAGLSRRSIARRPRCRAARRSASGSPRSSARTCRACATCWMSPPSACIRATTRSCWTRSRSWRRTGTRSSSSSTTRTPSAARITCSISAPRPACAAARWWAQGTVDDLIRNPRSDHGPVPARAAHASGAAASRRRCAHAAR